MAGTPGSGLQRGQDHDRAPRRRVRLSWGSTSAATQRQAADQTESAAVRRLRKRLADEMRASARLERGGGHRRAQPDHPGLGCLLPGSGVQQGLLRAGQLRVEAHLQVGQTQPSRTSRRGGSSTATSASSTSSGTTGGCSATAAASTTAATSPTWSSSPGRTSSGTRWSQARRHPTTPPWSTTGPPGGDASNPRWTATTCACSPGRTGAVRSAGTTCSPPTSHHSPHVNGNAGG